MFRLNNRYFQYFGRGEGGLYKLRGVFRPLNNIYLFAAEFRHHRADANAALADERAHRVNVRVG